VERERIGRVARLALAPAIAWLRRWDLRTAARPDQYIAISSVVAERIRRWYGRDSKVIPPPVDITRFGPSDGVDGYYLVVSRLNGYKRIDLAVEAFSRIGLPLLVVGEGPQRADLERRAGGNVRFLGALPDPEVAALYARCKALVLPGEEDFGLTVIEANASGRPVVAFGAGGALDSVVDGVTGVLFEHQSIDSLTAAVDRCERQVWSSGLLRRHAEAFGEEAFRSRFMAALAQLLETRQDGGRPQPSDPAGGGRSRAPRSEARHSSS
jgi:glycosyltransferase involved in cell wall biosynthesis